jgi:aspartyl-tRNA synthetase
MASEDLAKDNYGDYSLKTKIDAEEVDLKSLGEEHVGKTVNLRAYIQNSRAQGAKMVFLELRTTGSWAIQAIVAASPEGKPVSKQMVKWVGKINLESIVEVEAIVQKPLEPVKSTRVSDYELHLQKVYIVQTAPEKLGLTFASASVKAGRIEDDEEDDTASKLEGWFKV